MLDKRMEMIERHIKTHSERSDEDRAAVSVLTNFLRSKGKINTNFSCNDKWPNSDGTFEFVSNPEMSRKPEQNFVVQIKGTHIYEEKNGIIAYSLKNLAFPAFIYRNVTLDPGILFVVLNPDERGLERVFWKYMSVDFVHSIHYEKDSVTLHFTEDEEIKNTDESIDRFCTELEDIMNHHSFVLQLDNREYSKSDIEKIIIKCDKQITEYIDRMEIYNDTREDVSQKILNRLNDLCVAMLMLNLFNSGMDKANIRQAWERASLNIETKFLATFYKSIRYIGLYIPEEGQAERLMLKYYNFLWQIRKLLKGNNGINILNNLEKFPLRIDTLDMEYYELVADVISSTDLTPGLVRPSRFYVRKKTPFFVGRERYYEVTLQLAGVYATKYNRITVYTKENISTNYSVQIAYTDAIIYLWGTESKIKIITDWKVSIEPICLNKLGKILGIPVKMSSRHREYAALMDFLTKTGINLLDFIDLQEDIFMVLMDEIYRVASTHIFRDVLMTLRAKFSIQSEEFGHHVIRYLLLHLREETLESVLPYKQSVCKGLNLSKKCIPFEKNPFISNLVGSRTNETNRVREIVNVAGTEMAKVERPYIVIRNETRRTGEIYFESGSLISEECIQTYNKSLDEWEREQGYSIKQESDCVCIHHYESTTIQILERLLEISRRGNRGQREYNRNFIQQSGLDFSDQLKKNAVKNAFVDSQLLLIYGAAGTGKTTLINYISDLTVNRRKLFLTKTHNALQNLKRRITNPGQDSDFISFDSFTKKVSVEEYDIIFVDECSTIDNRIMWAFLKKLKPDTFLVLAGDVHQIESIDFGNWFFYAKDIIKSRGASVELLNTWRTEDKNLISLWEEVRKKKELITEKLVIDGPFSEDIGPGVLEREVVDEVVLCLNYDGKFGLNNMNSYFQNANREGEAVQWQEWTYKVGDPILFNETKRFSLLYNNLKGRIVEITKTGDGIIFTVDVEIILTEKDCQKEGLELIDVRDNSSRIRFSVCAYDSNVPETQSEFMRENSVIPFQLAYAVSIHKAQGLEYDSVKVVIPNSNSEKITHGVFYTAITRAKKKLKIYWSAETMKKVVESFSQDETKCKSLEIIKEKILKEQ